MPTNDLADDHFLIKSSKIHFQDQLARRQGDFEHYRKSLDLQNLKGSQIQHTHHQQAMRTSKGDASQHFHTPGMKIKKIEPSWQAPFSGASPPPPQFASPTIPASKPNYPHVQGPD